MSESSNIRCIDCIWHVNGLCDPSDCHPQPVEDKGEVHYAEQ
jgi:hypothetical protein